MNIIIYVLQLEEGKYYIGKTHITNTEVQIKERFEYHLNKCKLSTENISDKKE